MGVLDLIGTGVSAISNVVGTILNRKSQKEANDTNILLAREAQDYDWRKYQDQNQWQEDMYNKYQSPMAEVEQLLQAGLNPALVFGNGSTGSFSAGAGGATPAAQVQPYDYSEAARAVGGSVNAYLQNMLLQKQIESVDVENQEKRVNAKYAESRIKAQLEKELSDRNLTDSRRQQLLYELNYLKKTEKWRDESTTNQLGLQRVQMEEMRQSIRESKERVAMSVLQRGIMKDQNERDTRRLVSDLREAKERIELMREQKEVSRWQSNEIASNIIHSIEVTRGVKLDNDTKEAISEFVYEDAKNTSKMLAVDSKLATDPVIRAVRETFETFGSIIPFAGGKIK